MPNWVCNHLTITGANAQKTLQSVLTKNPESDYGYDFDFNKITPMPKELNIIAGSVTNLALGLYLTSINPEVDYFGSDKMGLFMFRKVCRELNEMKNNTLNYSMSPEEICSCEKRISDYDNDIGDALRYGKQAFDNYLKYGAVDWYDWCCNNWGTKWNAQNTQLLDENSAEVYFDTAWSPVVKLLKKLSEKNPDCTFEYEFAEEQAAILCGRVVFESGKIKSQEYYPDFSKAAYELFFSLWGEQEDFMFNDKTNTYEKNNEEEML